MESETDIEADGVEFLRGAGKRWVHMDIHFDRVTEARHERDRWRRLALWAFVVAGVSILLMLLVAGNALDSQSVVAR